MAVNWRYQVGSTFPHNSSPISLTNARWVSSEFGDDRNDGSPDFPFASLNAITTINTLIISGSFINDIVVKQTTVGDTYAEIRTTQRGVDWNIATPSLSNVRVTGFWGRLSLSNTWYNHRSYIETEGIGFVTITIPATPRDRGVNIVSGTSSRGFASYNQTLIFRDCITGITHIPIDGVFGVEGTTQLQLSQETFFLNTKNTVFYDNIPFQILGGGIGNDEGGYSVSTTIQDLRDRAAAVFDGNAADYLIGCKMFAPADFINSDYTLKPTPQGLEVATMSTRFSHVGAYDINLRWAVSDNDYQDGDATTAPWTDTTTNLTKTGGKFEITDVNLTTGASVDSKIKTWGRVRNLKRQSLVSFESYLNGHITDSSLSWGAEIAPNIGTDFINVNVNSFYKIVVATGNLSYNGVNDYQEGDTIPTVAGQTTITGDGNASTRLREITETPNRKTVGWRFSNGGTYTNDISTRSTDDWMYVVSGSIIDSATKTYVAGEFLKYSGTAGDYSGTYELEFVFNDSEQFKDYEVSLGNNLSIDGTGKTNGEAGFDYSTEEGITCKYAQHRLKIQTDANKFVI